MKLVIGVGLLFAACSRSPSAPSGAVSALSSVSASPMPATSAPPASSSPTAVGSAGEKPVKYIGRATMRPDRTLVLDLYSPAIAQIVYPPSHPEYQKTLAHVGGLEPGQEKPVPAWPDTIDDGRVERAVDAWVAAKRGWAKSSYRTTITGTDADANIAVTVVHRDDLDAGTPGGGKSVALRLSAKDYQVVKELVFQ